MSDAVAGAGALAVSAGAVGACANATVASNAEPAKPAMVYLANIRVLLSFEIDAEKTRHVNKCSVDLKMEHPMT
jgi:hypothetical protein